MEERKQEGSGSSSSSSSQRNGLYVSSFSSSYSSEFFGSLFLPPFGCKAVGRDSLLSELSMEVKKHRYTKEALNSKSEAPGDMCRSHENEIGKYGWGWENYKHTSSKMQYQELKVEQPCQLSSSIYYGGQDCVYPQPLSSQQGSGINNSNVFKNDGEEDDSGGASRGNWWLGSLYY